MKLLLLSLFAIPCLAQEYKTTPAEQSALRQLAKIDGQDKADVLLEICSRTFKFSDEFIKAYEDRTAKVTPKKVGTPITTYYPDEHTVIPLIVAIRMTERGKKGQEFNLLLAPGRNQAPFKEQAEQIRKLIYSVHHVTKSKGPVRFNWGYYIPQLARVYNNGSALHMFLLGPSEFKQLKKPIFGRVGPYRATKRKQIALNSMKWSVAVSNYFSRFTGIKTGIPTEVPDKYK